jgi:hypothetical protein
MLVQHLSLLVVTKAGLHRNHVWMVQLMQYVLFTTRLSGPTSFVFWRLGCGWKGSDRIVNGKRARTARDHERSGKMTSSFRSTSW